MGTKINLTYLGAIQVLRNAVRGVGVSFRGKKRSKLLALLGVGGGQMSRKKALSNTRIDPYSTYLALTESDLPE